MDDAPALLEKLVAHVDLNIALHWGEFAALSAQMEHNGVPINMEVFPDLKDKHVWSFIRDALVPKINPQYGVYVLGKDGDWHWNDSLFEVYCARTRIDWPHHETTGRLDLRAKTFDSMAKAYPELESLRQLRHTRNKMRRIKLAVGADGRNRTVLWTHVSKTGRSQPKASQWIFSPAVWLRFLIKPEPGRAIAYIDWSAMEFQVAGALSGCKPMLELYASGSPYIESAKRFDEAPASATKRTHAHIHERFKVGCLGAQYQMQHVTLAQRLGVSALVASEMLNQHRGLFAQYWASNEDWVARSLDTGVMRTPLGWECRTGITEFNTRSIGNWPTQATSADILRIAVIWGHRRGIRLLGSVHDAVLIESSIERIDAHRRS
jgi:DNA polymerase I